MSRSKGGRASGRREDIRRRHLLTSEYLNLKSKCRLTESSRGTDRGREEATERSHQRGREAYRETVIMSRKIKKNLNGNKGVGGLVGEGDREEVGGIREGDGLKIGVGKGRG